MLLILLLSSCKPSIPGDIIAEDDMENILYDYHIAQSMSESDTELKSNSLYADVLKKYGVTQAEFDSSMVYYTRHYSLLSGIYTRIEERLVSQAMSMGGNVQDINSMGEGFESADTTNIWKGEESTVLVQYPPYHLLQFDVKADSSFAAGDRFLLSFDVDFLGEESGREVICVLAMRLEGDSIVTTNQHIGYSMHGSLMVDDQEREGIKSLSGFFTFKCGSNGNRSTAKLALLRNIKLIRMHTEDPNAAPEPEPTDSLAADSVEESPTPTPSPSGEGSE